MSTSKGAAFTLSSLRSYLKNTSGFDNKIFFEKVNVTTLENGRCLAEMKIEEEHGNFFGGLHGGVSSTLVDVLSSCALSSLGPPKSVSVELHIKFLKAAAIGDTITNDSKVTKSGKSLAFLDVEIKNKATGELIVQGSHTKFILQ